jgi:hypothetical protein
MAVGGIHPDIKAEMDSFIYKRCGASITITPDETMEHPGRVEWARFRWIDIWINSYEGSAPGWPGVQQAVAILRRGTADVLPHIRIQFHEEGEPYPS